MRGMPEKGWALAESAAAREQLALRLEYVVHVLHELDLCDRVLEPAARERADAREQERVSVLLARREHHLARGCHQPRAGRVLAEALQELHDVPRLGDAVEVEAVVGVRLRRVL